MIDVQRSNDEVALVVGGRLTASGAPLLRDALLEALSGARRVEVKLHEVAEADLTLLQLLCAAHRTSQARSIAFVVTGMEQAEAVRRLVRESGAGRVDDCPPGCLWESAVPGSDAAGGPV